MFSQNHNYHHHTQDDSSSLSETDNLQEQNLIKKFGLSHNYNIKIEDKHNLNDNISVTTETKHKPSKNVLSNRSINLFNIVKP